MGKLPGLTSALGRGDTFVKIRSRSADAPGEDAAISDRPAWSLIGRRNFLARATLAGAATLAPSLAQGGASEPDAGAQVNPAKPMPDHVTADEIKSLLQLEPNQTCGFVRETYKSELQIAPGGLPAPFDAGRPLGSALYFMVTPEAPVRLHRIKNDQLYHYYLGDPIEVLLLRENGDSELVVVGPNIVGGHLVQLFIPGNTFHTARVTGKCRWFLGASTEWPGVVPAEDVELGDAEQLAAKYPEAAADIRAFPVPVAAK
jgi:predicted cupin superfamily sugar epimerase